MLDISKNNSPGRSRLFQVLLILTVMGAGLLLRSHFFHLPSFFVKYGGDALWALLVFYAFGFLLRQSTTLQLSFISITFAWAIEFSQLYHAPWIDSIRAMRIGHLVLGSTFNPPDLMAYAVGIAIGAVAEAGWLKSRQ